jgi:hypothetical protein
MQATPNMMERARSTYEHFRPMLLEDIRTALESGYGRHEIVPFVIDVDGPHREKVVDRLCPGVDWKKVCGPEKVPVVRGIAPSWLLNVFTKTLKTLPGDMKKAAETGEYPVFIIHGKVPVVLSIDASELL